VNRFPAWKYALVALCVAVAFFYTLPNFFGESPAVQVQSLRATVKADAALMQRVEQALKGAGIAPTALVLDANSLRVRFADTDTQLKARDTIDSALNPDPQNATFVVALNLLPASPAWLTRLGALPMYLGLDLRGGVHFLLQVDMKGAITKRLDSTAADLRSLMRDKNVRHAGINREGQNIAIKFREAELREKARAVLADNQPDLLLVEAQDGADLKEGRLGTELLRIRTLFQGVDPGAVVLIDELCSGTNPSEAAEIISMVLRLLRKLSPHAIRSGCPFCTS